jgi:hypothetical protein
MTWALSINLDAGSTEAYDRQKHKIYYRPRRLNVACQLTKDGSMFVE